MANVFTLSPVPQGSLLPVVRTVGMIPFSLLVGATYATATGGIPITAAELNGLLQLFGIELQVKPADVIAIYGQSSLGYMLQAIKQADNSWKCRLWNGITEVGDGAITPTILGYLLFSPGSPS